MVHKNKKQIKYLIFLITIIFISCKDNCDVPAESFEQRFTVGKCADMVTDSILRVDSTYKSFNTICECEDYCNKAKQALNNTLIYLDSVIDNSKNPAIIQQAKNDKSYLLFYGPKCECK